MIYLDNSATTKIDEDVVEAMMPWLHEYYGNPSSTYSLGRIARVAIESAREEIASYIGSHPAEVYFTSGGTESNNTIIKSALYESTIVDAVLSSPTEHHAILHPLEQCRSFGTQVQYAPVDSDGRIIISESTDNFAQTFGKRLLVSIMHANNETGVIQPIEDIRKHFTDGYIHTDAVQSFGKIRYNFSSLGIDFASFSAHKIHGPKGIGAMYIRKGIDFKAHQQGGGQERNRRAGTEAVALIIGFQTATRKAYENLEKWNTLRHELTTLLRRLLTESIPNIRINTPIENSLPSIINCSFLDAEKLDGESILQMMDMNSIACSNGSACVSGTQQPSHVLAAMGLSDAEARAAVRFSVSTYTTHDEITTAVSTLNTVLSTLRSI